MGSRENYFGKGQGDCVKLLIDLENLSCLHAVVRNCSIYPLQVVKNVKEKKKTGVSRIAKKGLKQAVH